MPVLTTRAMISKALFCFGAALSLSIATSAHADAEAVYELRPELDIPVMAVSGLLGASYVLSSGLAPAHCAPLCPRADLMAFDRPVAGWFDRDARLASDVAVWLTLSAGGLTAALDGGLTHLVVAVQAVLVSSAITVTTTMAVRRPRPLLYGERAPLEERTAGRGSLSFPSGHTGNAFAATLAIFHGMRARDPDSALPWVALGVGLALSSTVAAGRVLAGDHFPSDVLAGAVIGASIGWIVPELHRAGSDIALVADAQSQGISIRGVL
jgi:membrane-associated phospholipid phosphatase